MLNYNTSKTSFLYEVLLLVLLLKLLSYIMHEKYLVYLELILGSLYYNLKRLV